jgi:hypothetical protein
MSNSNDLLPNIQLLFVDIDPKLSNEQSIISIRQEAVEDLRMQGLTIRATYNTDDLILSTSQNIQANLGFLAVLFSIAKVIVDVLEKKLAPKKEADLAEPKAKAQLTINIDNRVVVVDAWGLNDIPSLVADMKASDPDIERRITRNSKISIRSNFIRLQNRG